MLQQSRAWTGSWRPRFWHILFNRYQQGLQGNISEEGITRAPEAFWTYHTSST